MGVQSSILTMQNLHPDDQNILRHNTKRMVLREALGGGGVQSRILNMQNLCLQDIVVYLKSPPEKRKIQKTYYSAIQTEICYGKH